jgi:hypothetical protein
MATKQFEKFLLWTLVANGVQLRPLSVGGITESIPMEWMKIASLREKGTSPEEIEKGNQFWDVLTAALKEATDDLHTAIAPVLTRHFAYMEELLQEIMDDFE